MSRHCTIFDIPRGHTIVARSVQTHRNRLMGFGSNKRAVETRCAELELIGIREVGQGKSRSTPEGNEAHAGDEVSLDLVLVGCRLDLHLRFDGPDIGLSVLVNRDTTFGTVVVLGTDGGGCPGGNRSRCCSIL